MTRTTVEDRVWLLRAMHEYVQDCIHNQNAHIIWLDAVSDRDACKEDPKELFKEDFTESFEKIAKDDAEWQYVRRLFSRLFKKY